MEYIYFRIHSLDSKFIILNFEFAAAHVYAHLIANAYVQVESCSSFSSSDILEIRSCRNLMVYDFLSFKKVRYASPFNCDFRNCMAG